eukprot:CAMPEP_0184295944 /NCGR_PEP_ID=MMETSP1049-20130417/6886_1 /TAXON_ID=77928 /ORGANISM="Proteomonas sulcata, Strain CCMP704" /LENGTH=39 /DNA_ID= /DNA_START= /DNA_END= /DNA_ORIENTATION=
MAPKASLRGHHPPSAPDLKESELEWRNREYVGAAGDFRV